MTRRSKIAPPKNPQALEQCLSALARGGLEFGSARSPLQISQQLMLDAKHRSFYEDKMLARLACGPRRESSSHRHEYEGSILSRLSAGPSDLAAALAEADPASIDLSLDELLGRVADPADASSIARSPLQWCATFDWHEEARLLLAAGAKPELFKAGVSAVGLAAYSGSALCLAEMMAFGANIRLELLPEHGVGSHTMIGSTLLHRLAARAKTSTPAIALMLAQSRKWYPDLHCKTADGRTILDFAEGSSDQVNDFRQALLSAISDRERQDLQGAALSAEPIKQHRSL